MNDVVKIGIDVRLWSQTGIGRYIRNLVSELLILDKKNEYFLFANSSDIPEIKSSLKNTALFQIVRADIPWHSAREQFEFPKLLNKFELDLVHFPYFSIPIFYKKPYIVTVHDLIINSFPTGRASTLPQPLYQLKRIGYSVVLKTALKKAKKILTPTSATKKEIEKNYRISPSKIVITPEGVDSKITDFTPILFQEKIPYFLYVGNAYPHKNIELLIDAFVVFRERNPEYMLKLVGQEDYFYKKLKEKVQRNSIQNIEFLGFIPDNTLGALYKNALATVVPSLMEGFGLTALEAMQQKSLVIVSEIPALSEICKDNAFYFKATDALSLAKTFEEVTHLKKEEVMKRIEKAYKHAHTFSWKKTAMKTLDVYLQENGKSS